MERLKWPEDEPIEAKMVTRAVQNAQKQIEELNYERRKNVLKYDEVMNGQRTVIYGERRKILEGADLTEEALGSSSDVVEATVATVLPAGRLRGGVGPGGTVHGPAGGLPGDADQEQIDEIGDSEALQEPSSRTRWPRTRRRRRRSARR